MAMYLRRLCRSAVVALFTIGSPLAAQELRLSAPSVTVTGTRNLTTVTWSQISGALRYAVMRRTAMLDPKTGQVFSAEPWAAVATVVGGTYGDVLPRPSVLYEYRVDAGLRMGTVSSAPVSYPAPPFTTPTNVAITGSGVQANVVWAPAAGVSGYQVWRRTLRRDGSVFELGQRTTTPTPSPSFADVIPRLGEIYEYQIVSIDPTGVTWPSGWAKYDAPPLTLPPPPPPVVTIVGTGDRASLSWTATAGAIGYTVSRAQLNSSGQAGSLVQLTPGPMPAIGFTDALPAPSTRFQYAVTAVMPDMSLVAAPGVVFDAPPYSTPGNITVAGAGGRVGITWCAASGVMGYIVWRRTAQTDGSIRDLSQRMPQPLPAASFIDVLPTPGLMYEFQVVAVGLDGRLWPSAWVRYTAGTW